MKDIVFLDFDFNRLGVFPGFISLNFEKKYCGYGTAEVHFPIDAQDLLSVLDGSPYLFFVAGGNAAVVTGWRVGEDIAVFGRTPEWLLTKRGVGPISRTDMSPENFVREVVQLAAGDFLELGEQVGFEQVADYNVDSVRILHDVICETLKPWGLGFEVVPNMTDKQFAFRIICGSEQPVCLSYSNKTAYDAVYTVDMQDAVAASGWYERKFENMGGWSASDNKPTLQNGVSENYFKFYEITSSRFYMFGLDCNAGEYLFCDTPDGIWKTCVDMPDVGWAYIDNSSVSGVKKWDAVLSGVKTEKEAVDEISRLVESRVLSTEVKRLEYGKDYKLGDVVRIQPEFGQFKKTEKKRVTSVGIYYDVNKTGVVPMLSSLEE